MVLDEEKVKSDAHEWIKSHRNELIQKFADSSKYPIDPYPTTIFMAGSPGAGKTEFAKNLAATFDRPVIIDADEIRKLVPGYKGKTAFLYQHAANKGVNILYDYSCRKGFNIIMDGTFAYNNETGNIQHSLKYNRNIEIYFLYQDPILSWEFTKKREKKEYRNVPKEIFIKSYIKSIENAEMVKREFGSKIKLNIVIKNFERDLDSLKLNTDGVANYISKVYTTVELKNLLK